MKKSEKQEVLDQYHRGRGIKSWKTRKLRMTKKELHDYFSRLGKISGEARRKKLSTDRLAD